MFSFSKVISIVDESNIANVLEKTIDIYNSPIPVCWNYSFDKYPPEYLKKVPQDIVEKCCIHKSSVKTHLIAMVKIM